MTLQGPNPNLPAPPNFSGQVYYLSPSYLQGYFGSRYMFALALQFDAMADAASYAVRARFPTHAPDDALPVLSSDRQIDRGPSEPRESFEARLIAWLDLWRRAGSAWAVLTAFESYFLPSSTTIETVNDTTTDDITAWNVQTDLAGPPVHYQESPGNWDWDGQRIPGRAWVIVFNGPWAQTQTWGDGSRWGDGKVWGFNGTTAVAQFFRSQLARWKAAGCSVPYIIIAFDPSWFQPTLPPGSPLLPDGTWGPWYKVETIAGARTYVPSRTSTAIYIDGVD